MTEISEPQFAHNSRPNFGEQYAEWKGWTGQNFGNLGETRRAYFESELSRIRRMIPSTPTVLEIGFGNGEFLEYCRSKDWDVTGVEMNPILVKYASDFGYSCICDDGLDSFTSGYFDMVVAFDVLEHLSVPQIEKMFGDIRRILKDRGVFLARFPNGDSPLSLPYQNGDSSHLTSIGSIMARELGRHHGFSEFYLGGESLPFRWTSPLSLLASITRRSISLIGNLILNNLYFRSNKVDFFSPNTTLIFIKG
jgi:SAM-dependent methyltransferase